METVLGVQCISRPMFFAEQALSFPIKLDAKSVWLVGTVLAGMPFDSIRQMVHLV